MSVNVFVTIGLPVQVLVYTLNVTVPVGLTPPVTDEVAVAVLPTVIELAESVMLTASAPPTLRVSLPHALVATLLLGSPL